METVSHHSLEKQSQEQVLSTGGRRGWHVVLWDSPSRNLRQAFSLVSAADGGGVQRTPLNAVFYKGEGGVGKHED